MPGHRSPAPVSCWSPAAAGSLSVREEHEDRVSYRALDQRSGYIFLVVSIANNIESQKHLATMHSQNGTSP